MPAAGATQSQERPFGRLAIIGVLAFVLIIRLFHLSSALLSPLAYQPGPDEDYYLRFGQAVATGAGQNDAEFTFMDPLYGFLLGGIFKLVGVNLFAVYLLQVLLDTTTAYAIVRIGQLLNRPNAGVYGAVLYGLTATAVMFCTTVLKEVWVCSFLTWWVVGALLLIRSQRRWLWLLFGVYGGVGIALRSSLALMAMAALFLPGIRTEGPRRASAAWAIQSALFTAGLIAALIPWSVRNHQAYGSFSPLPHNGGIVLHQVYNADNPDAAIWIPAFVNLSHPSEIWRGYAAEAVRRAGHALSPTQIDDYWLQQSLSFIREHPAQVGRDLARKTLSWLSNTEVPSSRSIVEEKMFSPVLRLLPAPAAWLLAMGLAGLLWLALVDRRWPIVGAPVFLSWFMMMVFFAESRFRFYAAAVLALCAGFWINQIAQGARSARNARWLAFAALAVFIGTVSVLLAAQDPPAMVHWDRIAWGYIKMGRLADAEILLRRGVAEDPGNSAIAEASGYVAAAKGQYADAVVDFKRAVELRPSSHVAHYNLARAYLALGDRKKAAAEAEIALSLNPAADYQALLAQINSDP